jgi:hypothetical protein
LSQGQHCDDPIVDGMIEVATDDGGKMFPYLNIVCKLKSRIGDKLYLGYGTEYWMKQTNCYKLSRASRIDMSQNYNSLEKKL